MVIILKECYAERFFEILASTYGPEPYGPGPYGPKALIF